MTRGRARRVVIVGAGAIGCGFLALLFGEAGWEVVLAAHTSGQADLIRQAGGITTHLTGEQQDRVVPVQATPIDSPAFAEAVGSADLIATSVGVRNLPDIARPLAAALARRPADRPVDVWVVENGDVAPQLAADVGRWARALDVGLPPVGFAGAVTGVVVSRGSWNRSARPRFVGDHDRWLVLDGRALRLPVPRLPGVVAGPDYRERLLEKLTCFSAGHALCAYLGAQHGHRHVHEAIADPALREVVRRALLASRGAFAAGRAGVEVEPAVDAALRRYADPELRDEVVRVARDPLRKLGRNGPLVLPARMVVEATGRVPPGFAAGIAAALLYRDPAVPESTCVSRRVCDEGISVVLREVCGLGPEDPLAREVVRRHVRARAVATQRARPQLLRAAARAQRHRSRLRAT